jgi:acyl-CoA thioesterase I
MLKRTEVRGVLLLLCSIALLCGASAPSAVAFVRPGVYLAMGDSLAAGWGASAPSQAYVPRVFAHLSAEGRSPISELVNLGVPGETTSSFLGGQLTQALEVIDNPTTVVRDVTLDIGANDLLGNPQCSIDPASSACPVQTNLTAILHALKHELRQNRETPRIAVLAYYNPWSGLPDPRAAPTDLALVGADRKIDCNASAAAIGLNDIIACTASPYGATVANAYPPFEGKAAQLVNPGDIHPNDAGYAVIARRFERALDER